MKHKTSFLMLIAAAVIATGCDKNQTTAQQLDKAENKAAEAARDIQDKNFTYAQREEFVKSEREQLSELNRDLDDLAARVEKSSEAVKADAQPRIEILRDRTARLNKQLDDAASATESTWDKFKTDVRKAQLESKEEFAKARQWLSDKIAP